MKSNFSMINSTLILITIAIINTILHELSDFFVALYYNLQPVLHKNYVAMQLEGTSIQQMVIAGVGPLFSLFFGIIMICISKKIKPSLMKLFVLWLGIGGILMFLGYVLIAPFTDKGDIGEVYHFLNIPIYISIALAVVSFVIVNFVFSKISNQFIFYKSDTVFNKNRNANQLFTYPIFISIFVVTLLNLPTASWFNLLPPFFMPFAYFKIMGSYKDLDIINPPVLINKMNPVLILTTLISITIFICIN